MYTSSLLLICLMVSLFYFLYYDFNDKHKYVDYVLSVWGPEATGSFLNCCLPFKAQTKTEARPKKSEKAKI